MDGGSDHPVNLLDICATCHAILTFGGEESCFYDDACVAHQQASYGLCFELYARKNRRRGELLKDILDSRKVNRRIGMRCDAKATDEIIRKIGIANYNVSMAVIHNIITVDEFWAATEDDSLRTGLVTKIFCKLSHGAINAS